MKKKNINRKRRVENLEFASYRPSDYLMATFAALEKQINQDYRRHKKELRSVNRR